jgi:hypothetical protein
MTPVAVLHKLNLFSPIGLFEVLMVKRKSLDTILEQNKLGH